MPKTGVQHKVMSRLGTSGPDQLILAINFMLKIQVKLFMNMKLANFSFKPYFLMFFMSIYELWSSDF